MGRTALGARGALVTRDDVSVVVVTYNAMPWIERCLESVAGYDAVVVDHGSTDGTLELVRERFPDVRVVEQREPRPRRRLEPRHPRDRARRTS